MPERNGTFAWVRKLARAVLIGGIVLLAIAMAGTVVKTVTVLVNAHVIDWEMIAMPVVAVLGQVLAGLALALGYGLVMLALSGHEALADTNDRMARVETVLGSQLETARKSEEYAGLSDRAKSLIYREHELEALRERVHHELMQQDYAAAIALIESVEKELGYAEIAAQLRQQVENTRRSTQDEKIAGAIARVQAIIDRRDWARALREAQRATRVFPADPKVALLVDRVHNARAQHKSELLKQYGEAIKKNDIDAGIAILKELDQYVTPQEAAALQESARGVFRAKLHNLGVQFAISVTEQRWADAAATGEQIVKEYPNSRMANEVREKMDMLRARADQARAQK